MSEISRAPLLFEASEHVVVVGGTRGLGLHVAEVLRSKKFVVSKIGRESGIAGKRDQVFCDISSRAQVERSLSELTDRRGSITGLVFSARYRGPARDRWLSEIETTLLGAHNIMVSLLESPSGNALKSVVLISSINGERVSPDVPESYHVSKAGLTQMGRYYAARFGGRGVRVNTIAPGTFRRETRKAAGVSGTLAVAPQVNPPLPRRTTAHDVCNLVEFLLSDSSSQITGQQIVIDGGASILWPFP